MTKLAFAAGIVITAKRDCSYGEFVVIDHHNGYRTLYAHNSKLLVKAGDRVKACCSDGNGTCASRFHALLKY